jgi:leucyl-tRNA synthetase
LEQIQETNTDEWPKIEKNLKVEEKIRLAIQINGKTKKIIEVDKDIDENNVLKECLKDKKISEQINEKKIIRTVFVKNKIINYLIK